MTGAGGFVGRAIMSAARNSGWTGIGLGRNIADEPGNLRLDVSDWEGLSAASDGTNAEIVVHAAGLAHRFGGAPATDFERINVDGTSNICRFAARIGAKGVILISSVSVYGSHERDCDESSDCAPSDDYGRSKLDAELVAKKICDENGIDLVILRLATVIGPEDPGNIARLIRAILRRRFVWIGDGNNRKTLIDREDVGSAVLNVAEADCCPAGVYNLCGETVRVCEVVDCISSASDLRVPAVRIPRLPAKILGRLATHLPFTRAAGRAVSKWLSDESFSGAKFRGAFGWAPRRSVCDSLRLETKALVGREAQ